MVSLISSPVRWHFDVLAHLIGAEPATDRSISFCAIEDAHCATIQRAKVIDTDKTILGARGEPAPVNDSPWTKFVLSWNSKFVNVAM